MPNRTAVVEPDGGVVTYAELAREADRYGRGLQALGLRPGDSVATALPNSAAALAVNFAAISIQLGHPVVLMDRFEPEEALALIERHRVTHSHMVPTQFRRLLALPEPVRAKYDVSPLRCVIHAAAPCPQEVKRQMLDWWGPVIVEYYAATEGGGTLITSEAWLRKPGPVGLPWLRSQVRILNRARVPVPAGVRGLVYMTMGASTCSYHGDQEKTEAAWADGMFTVGDIGYLDEDGYLVL